MKLILTGKSSYGEMVTELLKKSACDVEWQELSQAQKEDNLPIIYLPGNSVNAFLTDDAYVEQTLTEKIKLCKKADIPVVFLLDHENEASADLIRLVLLRAKALRERKKPLPVMVAAASMRCGVGELESLYRETRQSGVVFLKYDTVTVSETDGISQITLTEGESEYEVEAPVLVECEDALLEETEEFAKKMRLRAGESKKYSGAKWFLPAGFTGRRNIWVLEDATLYSNPETAVNGIIQEVAGLDTRPEDLAADVDDTKCAFCYTCYRVCPHAAPTPDPENHAMKIETTLCAACGMCKAVCPAGAIELKDISGEAQAEDTYKNEKILAFCCENSASLVAGQVFQDLPIEQLKISCGGEVNESRILRALKNYDKVLIAVCAKSACKHFDGNTRCELQAERAKQTLKSLGLDESRIAVVKASFAAGKQIREAAEALADHVKEEEV